MTYLVDIVKTNLKTGQVTDHEVKVNDQDLIEFISVLGAKYKKLYSIQNKESTVIAFGDDDNKLELTMTQDESPWRISAQ